MPNGKLDIVHMERMRKVPENLRIKEKDKTSVKTKESGFKTSNLAKDYKVEDVQEMEQYRSSTLDSDSSCSSDEEEAFDLLDFFGYTNEGPRNRYDLRPRANVNYRL